MSAVSVAVLVFLVVAIATSVGLVTMMFVKNKPFYGAIGLCLLSGPGSVLTFVYLAVSGV
ncbi:MAG TPA: hypothetical protein VH969_23245 [Actinophytocola sp.]|jgi:hypothetical protein|uniref:hypothetical protein n=1 Tax=Actinophytocola sp. TaxID=1872138 RepID=UPI002F947E52